MLMSTARAHLGRKPARALGGFTLVELMVAITLLSILVVLGAPSLTAWIRNTQVRTVAEALQTGMRLAQSEAVRRNRQVVFSLTNAQPGPASAPAADGVNWAVHTVPLIAGETGEFVQGGALGDVAAGVLINGPAVLCFNSAGRQINNPAPLGAGAECTASALVTYDLGVSGADRPLRVTVSLGGQLRMCDPSRNLATYPDGCPTT
jgi:type IV fimbrial biogenesis protein FimT